MGWNWCDQSTSGLDFLAFILLAIQRHFLVPGDVLVLDNCHTHHQYIDDLADILEPVGVRLFFLPKYSPELNPIELVWAAMKKKIRRYGKQTKEQAVGSIRRALDEV